jgi:hypothetical protein
MAVVVVLVGAPGAVVVVPSGASPDAEAAPSHAARVTQAASHSATTGARRISIGGDGTGGVDLSRGAAPPRVGAAGTVGWR